jgi:tetratricopeptide (TPR) repeat protein
MWFWVKKTLRAKNTLRGMFCILAAAGLLPVPAYPQNSIVEDTPPVSREARLDSIEQQLFQKKRVLFEQEEQQQQLEISIYKNRYLYDLNSEVVAEIMLRYDVNGGLGLAQRQYQKVEQQIQNENSQYAEILIKLQAVRDDLVKRGVAISSDVLAKIDEEIASAKRRVSGEALKKIRAYEKQSKDQLVRDVLTQKKPVDTEQTAKQRKQKEMLQEIAQLAGAGTDLTAQLQPADTLSGLAQQVMGLMQDTTYAANVQELEAIAIAERERIRKQYEREQTMYGQLQERVGELQATLVRNDLIKTATSDQLRRMYRREFRDALRRYEEGEYRITAIKIESILSTYPTFDDKGSALFVLAESKLALHLYDEAEKLYQEVLAQFPDSPYRGCALYRSTDLWYLYRDHRRVVDNYQRFTLTTPDSGLLNGIQYMVGRSQYFLGNYAQAHDLFSRIASRTDYYVAGLYMRGLCCVQTDSLEKSLAFFQLCVDSAQARAEKQQSLQQLVDDATITMGHLQFQLKRPAEALRHYNAVSKNSLFYDQVFAGKAWIYFNQESYDKTVVCAEQLSTNFPYSNYVYEMRILEGIAYTRLQLYPEAHRVYDEVLAIRDGQALLNKYFMVRARLDQQQRFVQQIEATIVTRNAAAQFSRLRRITQGLDSTYQTMGRCAQFLYTLYPAEQIKSEINAMAFRAFDLKDEVKAQAQASRKITKDFQDLREVAKSVRNEGAILQTEQEVRVVDEIVSRLNGINGRLREINITIQPTALDTALERSECGKLDLEFVQDLKRQQRIEEIQNISRDIDEVLEEKPPADAEDRR